MSPEFSRTVAVDLIGSGGHRIGIVATPAECSALAARFGWTAISALTADASLLARGGGIDALGTLSASIERACVASGVPVHETVSEAFAIHFSSAPDAGVPADEVELDENDLDVVAFDGQAVDIGEAVAQTLALSVVPFPRSPAADEALRGAGVLGEGDAATGPFAGLQTLLKR